MVPSNHEQEQASNVEEKRKKEKEREKKSRACASGGCPEYIDGHHTKISRPAARKSPVCLLLLIFWLVYNRRLRMVEVVRGGLNQPRGRGLRAVLPAAWPCASQLQLELESKLNSHHGLPGKASCQCVTQTCLRLGGRLVRSRKPPVGCRAVFFFLLFSSSATAS